MVAPMINRSVETLRGLLMMLLCAAVGVTLPVAATNQDDERLQQLLYGEALFLSHQQDYLSAISRLQLAEEQGLMPPSSDDARLLLARMKLAYGLHIEAGFDFHALLGDDVPAPVRNRAWYELARTFSNKGYYEAAAEALEHVQGEVPADIVGDYQLLQATVLMSLNENQEAAQVLERWQGASALAAYAHYNRGIALVRAGEHLQAVPALEQAVDLPAKGEELLALRDKAHLSLGYVYARSENYKRARKQLEAVRPQGPFSNRALLALGWIAHKQGRSESALVSWMELRGRSPTDPAVLETLLVVPAVHRELDALQAATRDYEAAMTTYNSELNRLHAARESVEKGNAVALLLKNESASGQGTAGQAASGEKLPPERPSISGRCLPAGTSRKCCRGMGNYSPCWTRLTRACTTLTCWREMLLLCRAGLHVQLPRRLLHPRVGSPPGQQPVTARHTRNSRVLQARPANRDGRSSGIIGKRRQQTFRHRGFRGCRKSSCLKIVCWNPCLNPTSRVCLNPTLPACLRELNSSGICRARKRTGCRIPKSCGCRKPADSRCQKARKTMPIRMRLRVNAHNPVTAMHQN
jgi:tetratricopeptide (TPR) repeat protein